MEHLLLAAATTNTTTTTTGATTTILNGLNTAATSADYGTHVELSTVIGRMISVILGISGLLFLCLMVYAGILYLTANGEEAGVKKAKKLITSSIIGIIIVMASYALTAYVVAALTSVVAS